MPIFSILKVQIIFAFSFVSVALIGVESDSPPVPFISMEYVFTDEFISVSQMGGRDVASLQDTV